MNKQKGKGALANTYPASFMRGFTIIELLVVVAIIAVLAAIVLVNVTGYINQGKNAAIKANLATVLTNGAVFYDDNSTYDGFCGSANFTGPQAAIAATAEAAICFVNDADTAWCSCASLKTTGDEGAAATFCVDSTGYKKVSEVSADCTARCTTPATGGCID
ncbi:MAG: hypothetical protein A3C50_02640 [Candidatus Staskawiczbacteria bacterium RIFCSPHIGHO2_02_FULL_43_16]|uniref:Prepilin-type N-terminal cleavage/methylation domain-containing protein n=1 Tax=Candidatus Staskawiczbacteria bacterium RIFCSPHIGHO2_01_FULL_41_41 TaxID=1802203 RepID=A0A1G2HV45_9BACT|nr:MAG: hypothetical protein A2822_01450 [Candidatus Staskawiczbacteria bacterium RIFCSPHIGHO2_01_FULL_41_41]OGZ68181.1 MAG: hypothetical protein A3C50_02640 [Candidatus Staskawiczbacteria bacterium RIFCSPHIGHO2_02_FULL_43_16]OGZ74971.1 MAG: hypothetical protein A3A12_04040 [Candidatus Staskawiczbacteria bacterium RIFCSPLOWO2_01_FULL_43_17b]